VLPVNFGIRECALCNTVAYHAGNRCQNPAELMVLIADKREAHRRRKNRARAAAARAAAATGDGNITVDAGVEGSSSGGGGGGGDGGGGSGGARARVGLCCHLCGRTVSSLAGYAFHARACLRAWDRSERIERLPHRRRLATWRAGDPETQLEGEREATASAATGATEGNVVASGDRSSGGGRGGARFFWDVPASPLGDLVAYLRNAASTASTANTTTTASATALASSAASAVTAAWPAAPLVLNAAALAFPAPRRSPGPVPAPPRASLPQPPPPPLPPASKTVSRHHKSSDVTTTAASAATAAAAAADAGAAEDAYNRAATAYNAEAIAIFGDWQATCPNWRPVLLRLGPQQLRRLTAACGSSSSSSGGSGSGDSGGAIGHLGLSLSDDGKLRMEALAKGSSADGSSAAQRLFEIADPDFPGDAKDQARVLPGDVLWSVSVTVAPPSLRAGDTGDEGADGAKHSSSGSSSSGGGVGSGSGLLSVGGVLWSTRRFYGSTRRGADSVLVGALTEQRESFASPSPGATVGAVGPCMVIVLRRGCVAKFSNRRLLAKHMGGCCPDMAAVLRCLP